MHQKISSAGNCKRRAPGMFRCLWSIIVLTLLACTWMLPCNANMLNCGDRDCYDIMGLSQSATEKDIKKKYRELSLKYHPDRRQKDEEDLFVEVARAYEILGDPARRADYDYYIEHPDQYVYNYARAYYTALPKSNPIVVLLGFFTFISFAHYMAIVGMHRRTVSAFYASEEVRKRARRILAETGDFGASSVASSTSRAGKKNKKKTNAKAAQEEEDERLRPVIDGLLAEYIATNSAGKALQAPTWKDNLFASIPIWLFQTLVFNVRWYFRRAAGQPFNEEEEVFLTCRALEISKEAFYRETNYNDEQRKELLRKRLWNTDNLELYQDEQKEEFKKKFPDKYKRMIRAKRRYTPNNDLGDDY